MTEMLASLHRSISPRALPRARGFAAVAVRVGVPRAPGAGPHHAGCADRGRARRPAEGSARGLFAGRQGGAVRVRARRRRVRQLRAAPAREAARLLSRVHRAHARRPRAAAGAASSAAARRPPRTRATTAMTTIGRFGRSAHEPPRSARSRNRWRPCAARRPAGAGRRRCRCEAALLRRPTSRAWTARLRCSPRSRRVSSCRSTSATTGTRSPIRWRTASGSASTAA